LQAHGGCGNVYLMKFANEVKGVDAGDAAHRL
jgi:hypothetical protein